MKDLKNDLILLFKDNIVNLIGELTSVVIISILFFICYKILKKIVLKFLGKTNLDKSVIKFISSIMNIAGLVTVGIIILSIFNFPVSSIVTIFSAIVVGVGISFKESLSNLGAGAILLWSKQFKAGDYVSCLGIEGIVHDMSAFNVILRTTDNKTITIPNSKLINDTITNFSAQQTRRISITLTVPYGVNVVELKSIITNLLENDERILKDPEYVVGVRNLTQNGLEVIIAPWVNTEDYWSVYYDLMDKIVIELGENNIKAPCTQVDIVNKKKHSF